MRADGRFWPGKVAIRTARTLVLEPDEFDELQRLIRSDRHPGNAAERLARKVDDAW